MGKIWGNDYAIGTGTSTTAFMSKDTYGPLIPVWAVKAKVHNSTFSSIFRYELIDGFGSKVERAYRYASDEANYTRGLLNHTIVTDAIGLPEVKAHLEDLHGTAVYINYHHLAPCNLYHAVMHYLVQEHGYHSITGYCAVDSLANAYPTYIEHIGIRVSVPVDAEAPDLDALEIWSSTRIASQQQWDNPFKGDERYSTSALPLQVTVKFAFLGTTPRPGSPTALDWEANGIPDDLIITSMELDAQDPKANAYDFEFMFVNTGIPIDDFVYRYSVVLGESDLNIDPANDYFHTCYRLVNEPISGDRYFTHAIDAGTLPELESTVDTTSNPGSFFPLIFFRENFQNIADENNAGTPEYDQAKALTKQMGFDYQQLADMVFDPENPEGVGDVSQAFMIFGIPLDTNSDLGVQYLIDFFRWLEIGTQAGRRASINTETQEIAVLKNTSSQSIIFSEGKAAIHFQFKGIASSMHAGNFSYTVSDTETRGAKVGEYSMREYTITYRYTTTQLSNDVEVTRQQSKQIPVMEFRKQITQTQYLIVAVAEPYYMYKLTDASGNHTSYARVAEYKDMLIPLGHDFTAKMSFIERQKLYSESLHVQINSYKKEKLSWYQSSNFGKFMTAFAIVVTAISLGTAAPEMAATYAALAASTNAIVAVIIIGFIVAAKQFVLSKLFEILVKEIGADWGFIGSIILAAIAAFSLYNGNPSSTNLMTAATSLQSASETVLGDDIAEYEEILAAIAEASDTLQERYEEYLEGKENKSLEQFGLLSRNYDYESPEQFYQRKMMGAYTPELLVRGPELYFESALQLTTFN